MNPLYSETPENKWTCEGEPLSHSEWEAEMGWRADQIIKWAERFKKRSMSDAPVMLESASW